MKTATDTHQGKEGRRTQAPLVMDVWDNAPTAMHVFTSTECPVRLWVLTLLVDVDSMLTPCGGSFCISVLSLDRLSQGLLISDLLSESQSTVAFFILLPSSACQ